MDFATALMLASQISQQHSCEVNFLGAVRVEHRYKGRTLWAGMVGVFLAQLHGEEVACFAWNEDEQELLKGEAVVYFATKDIDSPAAAVRRHIVEACESLAA